MLIITYSGVFYFIADFILACIIVLTWKDTTDSFLVLLLLFSPCIHGGICSDRCTVDQRPGWETGSTMNSSVVLGKAVCISELCFLNSKMAITVFVLFTQLGAAKVIQWVKEH